MANNKHGIVVDNARAPEVSKVRTGTRTKGEYRSEEQGGLRENQARATLGAGDGNALHTAVCAIALDTPGARARREAVH
ncbi:unnamed protein product [Heligmosomoides polygyrus]|uniref:MBF1 domain-containing protein n=1 Tax=Heligmosomoides polygyrus TaxID=6339 RepID=A0A183G8H9_HELPZ|nr:unnamed protein product [Heligmosomoides polygyrus]